MGISLHFSTGTPDGSFVVGVGGGVAVRASVLLGEIVIERVFVVPGVELDPTGDLVEVATFKVFEFPEGIGSVRALFDGAKVNMLVPRTAAGGAETSPESVERVHPISVIGSSIKHKIYLFMCCNKHQRVIR